MKINFTEQNTQSLKVLSYHLHDNYYVICMSSQQSVSGRQRKDTHDNVEQYDVTKEQNELYERMRLGDIPVQR